MSRPLIPAAHPEPSSAVPDYLEELERGHRTLAENAPAGLPERIIRILPEAQAAAEAKLPAVNARMAKVRGRIETLMERAGRPNLSRKARVTLLREAATLFNAAVEPASACAQQSCAHCCHIPVAVSPSEAAVIGQAIGKKPRKVTTRLAVSQEYGYHRPCVFLKRGRCSIYEHRPFACRIHLSLDVNDRLCELIPESTVPVPLVNSMVLQTRYAELLYDEGLADIRDYFG